MLDTQLMSPDTIAEHLRTIEASLQSALEELPEYDPVDLDHDRLIELGACLVNDGHKLIALGGNNHPLDTSGG